MDTFPWEVLVLGLVLLGNRVVLPLTLARPPLFWGLQALDVAVAVAAVAHAGLPGRTAYPIVGWMVAALLVFHVVQNFAVREQHRLREEREAAEREHLRILRDARDDGEPPRGA
ncbi:MAG: hypothetical protein ACOZNI_33940 [Myxococcota bacterium]